MKATAVIGANWGDEGKGLLTDFLSQAPGTIVARFSGGANAGHTVVTPEGQRHVFHHFGSGSFNRAATFLSRFFCVNPFLWIKELKELKILDVSPAVFVHPTAPVTTPYDMLINQEVERQRGNSRHGSCGVGINETITRGQVGRGIKASKLDDEDFLKMALEEIRTNYVPKRLTDLKIVPSDWFNTSLRSDELMTNFIKAARLFNSSTVLLENANLRQWDNVVFEGSQGLLLDEGHRFHPHVTRSRTGLCNVMQIAKVAGIKSVDAVYVTRSYMTRHGAGPFPSEDANLQYDDDTNNANEWQGSLRFGQLDFKLLEETIKNDLDKYGRYGVNPVLAMTHLDQVSNPDIIAKRASTATGLKIAYMSNGPTRDHIKSAKAIPCATT